MTVGEVIDQLAQYQRDQMVYVPSTDGRIDLVVLVNEVVHLNTPDGISIPNDVVLLPDTFLDPQEDCPHE